MTNATVLTINELTANGWLTEPAGNTFDTGTSAVTIYGTIDSYKMDRIVVRVANGGTGALLVSALAGDNPPALRSGLGAGTVSIGIGTAQWFGPFESARFLQNDGSFGLTLTPDGTIVGTVLALALPYA